jgi:hypothetical protein
MLTLLAVSLLASTSALSPGDVAAPFELQTVDGQVFRYSGPDSSAAFVLHVYNSSDAFSAIMWSSNSSIDEFLVDVEAFVLPSRPVQILFASCHETDADAEVRWMRQRLEQRGVASWMRDAFVFLANSSLAWQGPAGWIPKALAAWTHPTASLTATSLSAPSTRMDGMYSVFPWPAEPQQGPASLSDAGDGCEAVVRWRSNGSLPACSKGDALLMSFVADALDGAPVECGWVDMTLLAQSAGASLAVGFGVSRDNMTLPPIAMPNCSSSDGSCAASLSIPPTSIPTATGWALRATLASGRTVNVSTIDAASPAMEIVVNGSGVVGEGGWRKFASLKNLAWLAQWMTYTHNLEGNLTTDGVLVLPVYERATLQGHTGIVVNVSLPSRSWVEARGSRVVVDFALGCPGALDESCPVWDRTLHVYGACDGGPQFELARWITPFRRNVGRWLTDVTPLAGLIWSGGPSDPASCSFQTLTDWWASPWTPSFSIRFVPGAMDGQGVEGWGPSASLTELFRGGTFDDHYNDNRTVSVAVPGWAKRVALVAVITGHGSDNNGCGEFCVTSHAFQFGTFPNVSVTFQGAGTFWGSTNTVANGTIPLQHGTWQYGRDGWFDGNKVRPWLTDVTSRVDPGSNVTVQYWGLFEGHTPHPTQNPGDIIMWSWLAFWR